jgi:hypothetical protein
MHRSFKAQEKINKQMKYIKPQLVMLTELGTKMKREYPHMHQNCISLGFDSR